MRCWKNLARNLKPACSDAAKSAKSPDDVQPLRLDVLRLLHRRACLESGRRDEERPRSVQKILPRNAGCRVFISRRRSSSRASFPRRTRRRTLAGRSRRRPKCCAGCNLFKAAASDEIPRCSTKAQWLKPTENKRKFMKLSKSLIIAALVAGSLFAGSAVLQAQTDTNTPPAGAPPAGPRGRHEGWSVVGPDRHGAQAGRRHQGQNQTHPRRAAPEDDRFACRHELVAGRSPRPRCRPSAMTRPLN